MINYFYSPHSIVFFLIVVLDFKHDLDLDAGLKCAGHLPCCGKKEHTHTHIGPCGYGKPLCCIVFPAS